MRQKMEQFITLVNVGTACLAYYSKTVNNKTIFDG